MQKMVEIDSRLCYTKCIIVCVALEFIWLLGAGESDGDRAVWAFIQKMPCMAAEKGKG